jgi:hypothetical protein
MDLIFRLLSLFVSVLLMFMGFKAAKNENLPAVVWIASLLAIHQFQTAAYL